MHANTAGFIVFIFSNLPILMIFFMWKFPPRNDKLFFPLRTTYYCNKISEFCNNYTDNEKILSLLIGLSSDSGFQYNWDNRILDRRNRKNHLHRWWRYWNLHKFNIPLLYQTLNVCRYGRIYSTYQQHQSWCFQDSRLPRSSRLASGFRISDIRFPIQF